MRAVSGSSTASGSLRKPGEGKTGPKSPARTFGKWAIVLFACLLVAGLIFIAVLGRGVLGDLRAVSVARTDDVSWRLSQLELELLHAQNAAHAARTDPGDDLSSFRRRFDIFYSRVADLSESETFAALRAVPETDKIFGTTRDFLERTVPLIDGPDDALRAALPALGAELEALRPEVRQLALNGIQQRAAEAAADRERFSRTLVELAATLLILIAALVVALVVVFMLYRQGQRYLRRTRVVQSRFEAAVKSSLDAVLVIDTAGRIIEFNGGAETVFGFTRQEAIGADMAGLIIPEHLREKHNAGIRRFIETGRKTVIGTGRVRLEGLRKSGEIFPVEMSISVAQTEGESVFVSFLRDITPELRAEEELRTAHDRAQESDRAKSRLLTVMSHEMRTPLNGILGSLALIDRAHLSDRQKRHLKSIELSGQLLLSHVNDVLDLSRLDAEITLRDKGAFDLRELVQNVAQSLSDAAEARSNRLGVAFLSGDLDMVQGYGAALRQCLVNLVGNAIKFTTDGAISIEAERLATDDLVEIRVSDTGVGIAPEDIERIFDEFVTIDTAFSRRNTGTGLGLAITRGLVHAMEGKIEVDSIPGEGSLFVMRLPLPAAPRVITGTSSAAPGASSASIPPRQAALIVDDNEINRMVLTDMVRDLGIAVHEASDGATAIDILRERPFDILLLDISMPGIDGIEALYRIRALEVAWRDIPAIAVTAHASTKDHETILQADFSGLLVKPVTPGSLREAIASTLGGRATQPPPAGPERAPCDFEERFGGDRYRQALDELGAELAQFLDGLEAAAELTDAHRRNAHRLAGSAAVLGRGDLLAHLQELQALDAASGAAQKVRLASALRHELDRLPEAGRTSALSAPSIPRSDGISPPARG